MESKAFSKSTKTAKPEMFFVSVRKCTVRVAYACSKIGLFDMAIEYLREVEYCFPKEKETHPDFATVLRKKTEVTLDSFEVSWPKDADKVQKELSKANMDLVRAEEILSNSLGRNHRQFALTTKEIARLKILMGFHEIALKEIQKVLIPNDSHYLNADFSLIRSDAEKKLGQKRFHILSLEEAEGIYRKNFGGNHPMVVFTLQKLCTAYLDLGDRKKACKYFEDSEQACEVLKTNLREQLDSCHSDFLQNYNINTHPIVKRQQLLHKKMKHNPGEWQPQY